MNTLLFFYGTLKRGCRNHPLIADQEFLGPARTLPHYRLYDAGPHPCLVEDAAGAGVRGELWRVDAAMLQCLDEFEEVGHAFARRPVAVEGAGETVFAYFYCGAVDTYRDCGAEWSEK